MFDVIDTSSRRVEVLGLSTVLRDTTSLVYSVHNKRHCAVFAVRCECNRVRTYSSDMKRRRPEVCRRSVVAVLSATLLLVQQVEGSLPPPPPRPPPLRSAAGSGASNDRPPPPPPKRPPPPPPPPRDRFETKKKAEEKDVERKEKAEAKDAPPPPHGRIDSETKVKAVAKDVQQSGDNKSKLREKDVEEDELSLRLKALINKGKPPEEEEVPPQPERKEEPKDEKVYKPDEETVTATPIIAGPYRPPVVSELLPPASPRPLSPQPPRKPPSRIAPGSTQSIHDLAETPLLRSHETGLRDLHRPPDAPPGVQRVPAQPQYPSQQHSQQQPPRRPIPPAAYQQQHRRPPPNQQRPPPQGHGTRPPQPEQQLQHPGQQLQIYRRPPQRHRTPTWKRIWTRVEQSLDGLADLEDVVTGRAQQLYQSAKETVISQKQKDDGEPDNNGSSLMDALWSRKRGKTSQPPPAPPMDMSRFQKKVPSLQSNRTASTSVGTRSTDDSSTKKAFTSPYDKSTTVSPETKSQPGVKTRRIDWSDLSSPTITSNHRSTSRMIRANGGASTPPGTATSSTQTQQPQKQQKQQQKEDEKRFSFDYMDKDSSSLVARVTSFLPSFPRMPSMRRLNPFHHSSTFSDSYSSATLDAWKADDEESQRGRFLGLFRGKAKSAEVAKNTKRTSMSSHPKPTAAPLNDLMDRCKNGKTACLLSSADQAQCSRIGRNQAMWDLVALAFFLVGCRQVPGLLDVLQVPASLSEAVTMASGIVQSVVDSVVDDTSWAPLCFVSVFLAIQSRRLLYRSSVGSVIRSADATVSEEAQYGALFLRLLTGATSSHDTVDKLRTAAYEQIGAAVDSARLRTFVVCIFLSLIWMTVPVLQQLATVLFTSATKLSTALGDTSWPPQWNVVAPQLISSTRQLLESSASVVRAQVNDMIENPMRFAFTASIAASFVGITLLPAVGAAFSTSSAEPDEDEEAEELYIQQTEKVSNLGSSSATRLSLLSDNGGIDAALERWRLMIPRDSDLKSGPSVASLLRLVSKGMLSGGLLALPFVVHSSAGLSTAQSSTSWLLRWESLFDVGIVLLVTQVLVWNALLSSTMARDDQGPVGLFLKSLANAVQERSKLLNAPPADLQMQAAVSPGSGIVVKDLWAAHTTKRAWAVRGANFSCRSGEVLVILGDDSAGKSRLLTTLSEAIASPPPRAHTTTKVRGTITLGGLDVTKWDNRQLQNRLGLLLNDVRTISDFGQVLSGLSLEEILEPTGGVRGFESSQNLGPSDRACMMLALKMTGLYSTLFPKLPSKLNTVVTTNEEDMRPSPLRPHSQILSPAEWSKLLLARVLAQAVYDNDNAIGTNDKIEKSLVGTLLVLDDPTLYFSEVEEAQLIQDLRQSGAATVLTCSRWASGRYADRIAVVKNGAIVETGTHAELLNRGPRQSVYAAKWNAMTTSK